MPYYPDNHRICVAELTPEGVLHCTAVNELDSTLVYGKSSELS